MYGKMLLVRPSAVEIRGDACHRKEARVLQYKIASATLLALGRPFSGTLCKSTATDAGCLNVARLESRDPKSRAGFRRGNADPGGDCTGADGCRDW